MREKRVGLKVGLVGALGGAGTVGGGLSSAAGDSATGEVTISAGVKSDVCSTIGGLCFCNAVVGGMFVTCLMNVVMAR